nr:integrase, catalytic region, zinc finger, CCHC-type, peptidase aspartic, catalytic [Tanacetum cinerariifolium]
VKSFPKSSGSQPKSNPKTNRISPAKGANKLPVEDLPRTNKTHLRTTNRIDSSSRLKRTLINSNSDSICQTCNKCLTYFDHDMCVAVYVKSVMIPHSTRHNCKVERKIKQFDLGMTTLVLSWVIEIMWLVKASSPGKHSCYVRDTDGVDLIMGSRGSNLYTISVEDIMMSFPIYLLPKASKNKSWLWHRRLNHLNFSTINDLARKDLVRGLPRLKFEKDHLCSACQLGKSKKHTYKPKAENTNLEALNILHMDLCGPMRVQTINEKKYILVIVDDYSRFTWTVPRTPQQNGVVESRNRTLVEAARTMLIFSKAPIVFGALCYPTNDSEDLEKLQPTADTGIFVGYAPSRKGYRIYNKRTRPGTPLSTTIDKDAPSPHISPSSLALQSHSLPSGVVAEPHFMEDHNVAPVDNNLFVNVFALEPHSKASSSGDINSTKSPYVSQSLHHLNK